MIQSKFPLIVVKAFQQYRMKIECPDHMAKMVVRIRSINNHVKTRDLIKNILFIHQIYFQLLFTMKNITALIEQ